MFFALAEAAMHLAPSSFFLAIDQHDYADRDTLDYDAVLLATELLPAPDVVVMGTSRAREAVQSPDLVARLRKRLGRGVVVRNYGVASGRIDTSIALLDRLAAVDKLPRVAIVAVDGSDFRDLTAPANRFRLVSASTAAQDLDRNGLPSEGDVTHILGNSDWLRLRRARPTVHYRLVRRGDYDAGDAMDNNAAYGGTSAWARAYEERLARRRRPPRMKPNPAYVARVVGGYVVREAQLAKLRVLVDAAIARGVQVVLAELPVAPPVREATPVTEARDVVRAELERLAGHSCVRAFAVVSQDPEFSVVEFRDPSHVNARGARYFSKLIAPTVAAALDAGECGDLR